MPLIWKYVLAWFAMMVLAILNGLLRESTYGKKLTELRAHQLSTLTGILLIGGLIAALVHFWSFESIGQAWLVGAIWLAMTVAFEFGFGHFIAGHPWPKLFHDYNLAAGRVWPLFLLWVLIAPPLIYRFL